MPLRGRRRRTSAFIVRRSGLGFDADGIDVITIDDQCAECKKRYTTDVRPQHQCPACNQKWLEKLRRSEVVFDLVLAWCLTAFATFGVGLILYRLWPTANLNGRVQLILGSITALSLPWLLFKDRKRNG
jgi:DNA-directed RNA polymerase subunit RPC12/RpoP